MTAHRIRVFALIAIVLTSVNMRAAVTSLSPLVGDIATALHMGGTAVGLLGTIPTAMFALSAFASPALLRLMSGPKVLTIAMVVTFVGLVLRSLGPNVWLLFLGSVAALFAVGITNATIPLAVRAYFPDKIARMSMVYLLGMQIGMLVAPLVSAPVASLFAHGGWQWAIALWALPAGAAAIAWLPLFTQPRRQPMKETSDTRSHRSLPVWKTSVGLGLAVMFGFTSFASYAMMMFIPQFFTSAGATKAYGGMMLAVWSGLGLVLTGMVPRIVERFRNVFGFVIFFAVLFFIGNTGMALAPMSAPWLWVALSSLGPMTFPMALTLINVRAKTMEGAVSLSSFCQGAGYVIACGGPFLMGLLLETTKGWFWPNVAVTVGLVAIVCGGFFATRDHYVEDELADRG